MCTSRQGPCTAGTCHRPHVHRVSCTIPSLLSSRPLHLCHGRRALEPEARVPSALVPAGAADQHVGRVTASARTTQEHDISPSVRSRGTRDIQTAEHRLKALGCGACCCNSNSVVVVVVVDVDIDVVIDDYDNNTSSNNNITNNNSSTMIWMVLGSTLVIRPHPIWCPYHAT
jgi:hypothetical protein